MSEVRHPHEPPLRAWQESVPPAPDWFRQALAQPPERSWQVVQGAPIEVLAWGRWGDPGLLLLHGDGAYADGYSHIAPLLAHPADHGLPGSAPRLGGWPVAGGWWR